MKSSHVLSLLRLVIAAVFFIFGFIFLRDIEVDFDVTNAYDAGRIVGLYMPSFGLILGGIYHLMNAIRQLKGLPILGKVLYYISSGVILAVIFSFAIRWPELGLSGTWKGSVLIIVSAVTMLLIVIDFLKFRLVVNQN